MVWPVSICDSPSGGVKEYFNFKTCLCGVALISATMMADDNLSISLSEK